jgi:methionine-rich copper-binding protein CopC
VDRQTVRTDAGSRSSRGAVVTVAVAALLMALLGAFWSPAQADVSLVVSDPEFGEALRAAPDSVSLRFTGELIEPAFVVIRSAEDADHEVATEGDPEVDFDTVTQLLEPGLGPGSYVMAYRIVAVDGHPLTGEIPFSVDESSSPGAAQTPGGGEAQESSRGPEVGPSAAIEGSGGDSAVGAEPAEVNVTKDEGVGALAGMATLALLVGVTSFFLWRRARRAPG